MEDSSQTIQLFLEYLNLPPRYAKYLINEGFDDVEFISELTETDMTEIGITKRGHQKRVMKFVSDFPEESLKFYKKYGLTGKYSKSSSTSESSQLHSTRHIGRRTKHLRNMKIQTKTNMNTFLELELIENKRNKDDIPEEIVNHEICKQLYYFIKKCIILLESGYTEKFLISCFHPVDQLTLNILDYQSSELLKMFEDGETNISKSQMLRMLKKFTKISKKWITDEYVIECSSSTSTNNNKVNGPEKESNGCFTDRYGGRFAATFPENKFNTGLKISEEEETEEETEEEEEEFENQNKDIPSKIHFRYFRDKWYLTNFT